MEDGWEDISQLVFVGPSSPVRHLEEQTKKTTRIRDFNKWIGSFESHLLLGKTICNTFNIIHVETVVNVNILHSQAVKQSVCLSYCQWGTSLLCHRYPNLYLGVKLPTFYFTLVKDSVI